MLTSRAADDISLKSHVLVFFPPAGTSVAGLQRARQNVAAKKGMQGVWCANSVN